MSDLAKVLFLLQLPPPVHGASVANKAIKDSALINDQFICEFIDISSARDVSELGGFSVGKVWISLCLLMRVIWARLRFRPDVVYITLSPHGFAFLKDSILLLAASLFFRSRVLIHLHGKGIKKVTASGPKFFFYRAILSRSRIIQLSPSLYSDIEHLVCKEKVSFVGNGVPAPLVPVSVSEIKTLKFIYLSNFMREKGALEFLDACSELRDFEEKFEVTFVGKFFEPDYQGIFLSRLRAAKLNNINLIEGAYGEDKERLLRAAHVFVLPTYYRNESFPISILEAMSHRSAVISTAEGAIADIVDDGVTGIIVGPRSSSDIAQAMLRLINNPELAVAMGLAGYRKFEENYTLQRFERAIAKEVSISCALAR